MEITPTQFAQIEHCLPLQRGNVSLTNLQVLNAVLYVAEPVSYTHLTLPTSDLV